jgi:hypothetical protein
MVQLAGDRQIFGAHPIALLEIAISAGLNAYPLCRSAIFHWLP